MRRFPKGTRAKLFARLDCSKLGTSWYSVEGYEVMKVASHHWIVLRGGQLIAHPLADTTTLTEALEWVDDRTEPPDG